MRAAKDELRQKMRKLRLALEPRAAAARADQAARFFLDLSDWRTARCVALYAPVRGEIDTRTLHDGLARANVACAYPRIDADALRFARATPDTLVAGPRGIPSPPDGAEAAEDIDVFVVPGLAYDQAGERLGFGGGFYDRALAARPEALRIGFAFDFQIVPAVPIQADDQHVDIVVTEAGARRSTRPQLRRLR